MRDQKERRDVSDGELRARDESLLHVRGFHRHGAGCLFCGRPGEYCGSTKGEPRKACASVEDINVRPDLGQTVAVLVGKRVVEEGPGGQRVERAPIEGLQALDHVRGASGSLGTER